MSKDDTQEATMTSQPQTPVEIDTEIAAAYGTLDQATARLDGLTATVQRIYNGRTPRYIKGRPVFDITPADAWQRLEAAATNGDEYMLTYSRRPSQFLAERTERQAAVDTARAELDRLEALYTGWSRFFLVTSSNGGHIHSSTRCSTCRLHTTFGWLPELSGLTEADAVAKHGTILCSVCFPTAPVEWTLGRPVAAGCEGSGKAPVAGSSRRTGRTHYGTCTGCGERFQENSDGTIRKHKPAKKAA